MGKSFFIGVFFDHFLYIKLSLRENWSLGAVEVVVVITVESVVTGVPILGVVAAVGELEEAIRMELVFSVVVMGISVVGVCETAIVL